jgi:hypothetical protein
VRAIGIGRFGPLARETTPRPHPGLGR